MVVYAVALLLTSLFTFGMGWKLGHTLLLRHPDTNLDNALQRVPALYGLVIAFVGSLAATWWLSQRPDLMWQLPLVLQLHFSTITWSIIAGTFGTLYGLCAHIAWRARHPQKNMLIFAGVLVLIAFQIIQWTYTRPIADTLSDTVNSNGIVLQSNGASCAAASGANIAWSLGVQTSERDVARHMETTLHGTSMAQIVSGMHKLELDCRPIEVPNINDTRLKPPAFLFIDHPTLGPESHAVAYIGRNRAQFTIWDPLVGAKTWSAEDTARVWKGRAVACQRP